MIICSILAQEIVKILGGISSSKSVTKDCSKGVNNHVKNCLFSLRVPRLRILPTHKFTCSEIIEFRK